MNSKELTVLFKSLFQFLSTKLNIPDKNPPKIILKKSISNAEDVNGYTGNFEYGDENNLKINIFVTDRHFLDVLRTFSHEIIHYWQYLNGKLQSGKAIANDYAQTDPKMRRCEMEAYLLGNILFRDWQDANRKKKKVNEHQKKIEALIVESILKNQSKNNKQSKITLNTFCKDIINEINTEI